MEVREGDSEGHTVAAFALGVDSAGYDGGIQGSEDGIVDISNKVAGTRAAIQASKIGQQIESKSSVGRVNSNKNTEKFGHQVKEQEHKEVRVPLSPRTQHMYAHTWYT